MEEGITEGHVRAFLLNLMVAGNEPGPFVWNDGAFKERLYEACRASSALRPFVKRMIMREDGGRQIFERIRGEIITLWLDAVDPNDPQSKAYLSDAGLRLANDLRHLLTQEQLDELRRVGPGFMRALVAA